MVAELGLFKLRGHKNQITGLHFLQFDGSQQHAQNGQPDETDEGVDGQFSAALDHPGFLLSTSKDALIKIWDLSAQHCIETHVAQSNGECWSMGISPDYNGCITAGNDGELKVWSIDLRGLHDAAYSLHDDSKKRYLHDRGAIYRQGKDKTINVSFHSSGAYVVAHGSEKAIEVWRVRSEAEIQKVIARKLKRRREKTQVRDPQSHQENGNDADEKDKSEDISSLNISEVFVPYVIIRTGGKVRAMDWAGKKTSKVLQLLVATTNNQIELFNVPRKPDEKKVKSNDPPDYTRTFSVDMPGHRSDIRSVNLSSDDRMLASASNGNLKIWNVRTQNCIRTLECGYALCSSFLPGDKIVVVGNRNGELELFDIASSSLIETIKAHEGPIWALHVHPDGKSVVTGSADKSAKFWNFEIIQEEILGTKRTTPRLSLAHTRTLKVTDDILSLRFSPDARLIAVSFLDNTVKVFFVDSLKLFLNLYGHKLPVLNMDISYDSKLIVTCSADKNVRIWGLDFGDCHKAIFAHQDSIMQIAFVPHNHDGNGHYFFSASKDRLIKYWDGDKFEQIQKLDGHHGEIWAMAVSRTGEMIVTASHDKSIRIWHQTDEQIFLEEEREKELEDLYESTLTTSLDPNNDEDPTNPTSEVAPASKQTSETLMAGEKLAEALELAFADLDAITAWNAAKAVAAQQASPAPAPPQRHPIFTIPPGPISAEAHVLAVMQRIPAAALQDALLVLPLDKVDTLFTFLRLWAEKGWSMQLTCRVLFFLLKTHHRQIVASRQARLMLDGIRKVLREELVLQKDRVGFNLAAVRVLGQRKAESGVRDFVDGMDSDGESDGVEGGKGKKRKKKRKRAFVDVA